MFFGNLSELKFLMISLSPKCSTTSCQRFRIPLSSPYPTVSFFNSPPLQPLKAKAWDCTVVCAELALSLPFYWDTADRFFPAPNSAWPFSCLLTPPVKSAVCVSCVYEVGGGGKRCSLKLYQCSSSSSVCV